VGQRPEDMDSLGHPRDLVSAVNVRTDPDAPSTLHLVPDGAMGWHARGTSAVTLTDTPISPSFFNDCGARRRLLAA